MKSFRRAFSALLLGVMLFALTGSAACADQVLTLPGELKLLEDSAFFGDQSLGQVVLPDGITTINSKAFAGSSVSEVNLPSSLEYIADDAFDACPNVCFTAAAGSYGFDWAETHGFTVTDPDAVRYRALLIGNNAYKYINQLGGCINDMNAMKNMLLSFSNGYACTTLPNATEAMMVNGIRTAFADATENDVSLFYYAGHGNGSSDAYNGALCGIDTGSSTNDPFTNDLFTANELAAELSQVPGRVIVILDSCHSGAVIGRDAGDTEAGQESLETFNQAFIDAFAQYDTVILPQTGAEDGTHARSGALAKNKFVVLTAASGSQNSQESGGKGLFTLSFVTGCGCEYGTSSYELPMPADNNADELISVIEIFNYCRTQVKNRNANQIVQGYAIDQNEIMFWR